MDDIVDGTRPIILKKKKYGNWVESGKSGGGRMSVIGVSLF